MFNFLGNTTTFHQASEIFGSGPTIGILTLSFLGFVSVLGWVWSVVFGKSKSTTRRSGSSGNRKSRDKVINELQGAVLKNTASTESFALMVGALMEKVKSFETRLVDTEDYIHEDLPSELDTLGRDVKKLYNAVGSIDGNLDRITQDLASERTRTDVALQKIQRNVDVINTKLLDFTADEYHQFCEDTTAELKTLHDAIFLPVNDGQDDSDYEP